jgi:hypothetical protein
MAVGVLAGCLAMILTISTSGGITGRGLGKTLEVDLADLPDPLRAQVCEQLAPAALAGLVPRAPQGSADLISYHISLGEPGARSVPVSLPETSLPAGTLDLIDELMAR